jgi:hypothetical protein
MSFKTLPTITIKTTPHSTQRYDTVGDWQIPLEGFVEPRIVVSQMSNPDYEFLVAVHELIEMYLTQRREISPIYVTGYDVFFEKNRKTFERRGYFEPGDVPACPVYHEHQIATAIERILAHELGINWTRFEREIDALVWRPGDKRHRRNRNRRKSKTG